MSTNADEEINKILKEVYDYGYNVGDGFKQKEMVSDLLYRNKQSLLALKTRWEAEARLKERKEIALDNYNGHTFGESTNWEGKFNKFIENNEKCIKQLKAQLGGE